MADGKRRTWLQTSALVLAALILGSADGSQPPPPRPPEAGVAADQGVRRYQIRKKQASPMKAFIAEAPAKSPEEVKQVLREVVSKGARHIAMTAEADAEAVGLPVKLVVKQEMPLVDAFAAECSPEDAQKLRDAGYEVVPDPIVVWIPPQIDAATAAANSETASSSLPDVFKQVSRIRAHVAWANGFRGKNVVVAVVDTGVAGHHSLFQSAASRVLQGRDFTTGVGGAGNGWNDDNGHGTHVAGIVVGATGVGVAPEAQVLPLRCLRHDPTTNGAIGNESDILAAVSHAIALKADVVNLSLGTFAWQSQTDKWDSTLALAQSAGVFVAAAAGNRNQKFPNEIRLTSPGASPDAFTVGAVDDFDVPAIFTLRGGAFWNGRLLRKPDVAAPGVEIVSADFSIPTGPKKLSGTSMATPGAAGLAALLIGGAKAQGKTLTVEQIGNAIRDSAKKTNPRTGLEPLNGAGVPDAPAALVFLGLAKDDNGAPVQPTPPTPSAALKRLKAMSDYWESQGFARPKE